jgi:hypothetical protein
MLLMTTALDEIIDLKAQAKNRRDVRRYDQAVQILNRAIEIAFRSARNSGAAG